MAAEVNRTYQAWAPVDVMQRRTLADRPADTARGYGVLRF
jgi:hypothetical protein